MSTALITGGAGFIGSHLAERLSSLGWRVVALDDLSTGSESNLAHVDVELIEGSILEGGLVREAMRQCDLVFHLAAAVGVRRILDNPLQAFHTNLHGTENVLEAAAQLESPLVLASTSEIYGKSRAIPFREDADRLLGPPVIARWAYAEAKAMDEFVAACLARESGLMYVIARLFNTVGPRQVGTYGMVVPTFINQALAGQPLTVHGDGSQARCFTHVDDVVDALIALSTSEDALGRAFNVGSSELVTVMELAQRVLNVTGSSSPIVTIPYEEAYGAGFEDMPVRQPDTTELRRTTGWVPRRNLDDILADIIRSFRKP